MHGLKKIPLIMIIAVLISGTVLIPFVQSTQNEQVTPERSFQRVKQRLKTSLRNHIDQFVSLFEDSPVLDFIKDRFESTPGWEKIKSFLFQPEDQSSFLKQIQAYKVRT